MTNNTFKIGDPVKVLPNDEIGFVADILFSKRHNCDIYEVDSADRSCTIGTFIASDLAAAPIVKEYTVEVRIDVAENVVIATMYEIADGEKKATRHGHGHIIHDGELGVAQAASFACKRLYYDVAGLDMTPAKPSYNRGGFSRDY